MTPAARVQAAIEILDDILSGTAAEQALSRWARASRFAGSKDRAAVRDHVFDAIRCLESYAWLGGARTGRGIMLGALRASHVDPHPVFTGKGHAPSALTTDEQSAGRALENAPIEVQLDIMPWQKPLFDNALGAKSAVFLGHLRCRAPVDLRVNLIKTDPSRAREVLAEEGISAEPLAHVTTALRVTEGARKVSRSRAFLDGLVEVQDASSQAAVLACAPGERATVLDYCAGGGGKALALAALTGGPVAVHDIDPLRMRDIPSRAARAGVTCPTWNGRGAFDLVFVDAPCSGSGTWRRAPDAKWHLTPERLADLCHAQADVLSEASERVSAKGRLAYATCSVFLEENEDQISVFLERMPGWRLDQMTRFDPRTAGDGFFLAILSRTQE